MNTFRQFYVEAVKKEKESKPGEGAVKNKIEFSGGTETPIVKSDTTISNRGTQ